MEGLIFQSSEFGTDEIYANMEEYIMQITRDNYSQYAQMVQQMFGKKASSNDPLAQCDYGNFSLRFKPVDINFTKPNWDTIMTKRDKPAMSEEEFDEPKQWEIREINEIMNQCITDWRYFPNPRMFSEYGRQKGWERENPATDSGNPSEKTMDGFVEVTEQMELPF